MEMKRRRQVIAPVFSFLRMRYNKSTPMNGMEYEKKEIFL